MAKMTVIYERPAQPNEFDEYYFNTHIPLCEKLPNIRNVAARKVTHAVNTDMDLYLITELEFNNQEELQQAMGSSIGKEVSDDVANFLPFLNKGPIIVNLGE